MKLDHEIGIGRRDRRLQDGPDAAPECYVACQRFGRETQHVRPTGSESADRLPYRALVTRRRIGKS